MQPITGIASVCKGLTTQLNSATLGGIWSSNDTTKAKVNSSGLVSGIDSSLVTINYTSINGACSTTITRNVAVNNLPVLGPITSTATTICIGTNTYLYNTNKTGVWYSSNDSILHFINASVNGQVSGRRIGIATVTYIVVNANGCSDSAKTNIAVATAPAIGAIKGPSKVCIGESIQLTDSIVGGIWSTGTTFDPSSITADGVLTGLRSGTSNIYYTVYGASGCAKSVLKLVIVESFPTVNAITGNAQVCVGTSTLLSNLTSGGIWSSTNTAIATVSSTGNVTGKAIGLDTIQY